MPSQSVLLDANAALRYLLEDNASQVAKVAHAIEAGAEITIEVIAECVYVLEGVYGAPRSDVAEGLEILLEEVACRRREVAATALGYYRGGTFDFVDCVLAAEADLSKREILTFDKKLISLLKKIR